MRTNKIIAVLGICMSMAVACTKEFTPVSETSGLVHMRFTATNGPELKTTLTNGTKVEWTAADAITVIDAYTAAKDVNHNHKFTLEQIASDGSASFIGEAAESDVYFAAYPYDANDFITEEGKMRAALTSAQTASAPGTFDPLLNTAVATLRSGVFQFKNLGGLIKFTLTQENVTKISLTANDNGTVGGVFYVYFDEDGNIDDARTTVASARATLTLSPKGTTAFAPGTYYFVVAARTYTGGITMSLTRNDGDPKVVSTSSDVVVARSKVTNVGTIDTTVEPVDPVDPTFTPVTFPVVFPLGYPDGNNGVTGNCAATNSWMTQWTNDDACTSATRTTQYWTGCHGKLLCKEQNQAYVTWNWDTAISSLGVKYFIETANTASLYISTFGVKGIWTGDYFEFVLPVEDFEAGTTLELSMPIYTRSGPTFWEVLYKDGETWKSTAVNDLPAFAGSEVTRTATWAVPFGGAASSSTVNTNQSVEMTFDNAVSQGEILIRVKCVDGTIVSSADNTVKTIEKPTNSNNTANAPFYFWNPSSKASQAITIANLGTI